MNEFDQKKFEQKSKPNLLNRLLSDKPVDAIYQLKISLNDSRPNVWRRILVPKSATFYALHCAIQDSFGWLDSHLHNFFIAQKGTAVPIIIELPNPDFDDNMFQGQTREERTERIGDYLGKTVKQLQYTYDFGDNWQHTVLFEKELPKDDVFKYPQCVAGKNTCPPEDCGGVWGYEDLQKILKDPNHPEHKDMLEWMCLEDDKEFDPYYFDIDDVEFENCERRLRDLEKWSVITPTNSVDERLRELAKHNHGRIGHWEVGVREHPLAKAFGLPIEGQAMFLAVEQQSYFIFGAELFNTEEPQGALNAILNFIEKHNVRPRTLIISKKEKKLYEELKEAAAALDVGIEKVDKLKTLPQVLRDMTGHFKSGR